MLFGGFLSVFSLFFFLFQEIDYDFLDRAFDRISVF